MSNSTLPAADEGLIELRQRYDAARVEIDEISKGNRPDVLALPEAPVLKAMLPLRAATLTGLKAKAWALSCEIKDEGPYLDLHDELAVSLAEDILALDRLPRSATHIADARDDLAQVGDLLQLLFIASDAFEEAHRGPTQALINEVHGILDRMKASFESAREKQQTAGGAAAIAETGNAAH